MLNASNARIQQWRLSYLGAGVELQDVVESPGHLLHELLPYPILQQLLRVNLQHGNNGVIATMMS